MVKDSSCEFSTVVLSDNSSTNWEELQYYKHRVRIGRMTTSWSIAKVNKYAKTRHNTFTFPWQKLQSFTAVQLQFFTLGSVLSVLQQQRSTWTERKLLVPLSYLHLLKLTTLKFSVKVNLQKDEEQEGDWLCLKWLPLYYWVHYMNVQILSVSVYPL